MTGPELKAWRERLGLKQERAARLVGVPLRSWVRWEKNPKRIRMSELVERALRDAERELGNG